MYSIRILLFLLVNLLFFISPSVGSDCSKYDVPPEKNCGMSNGFQRQCVCYPFGGGCWCLCPPEAESVEGQCRAKPTRIGEACRQYDSCNLIPNAAQCDTSSKTCQCKPDTFPANDLASCISSPQRLNDSCSEFAPCEFRIPGSNCRQIAENQFQCKCQSGLFPNVNNNACYPAPKVVGDFCSPSNPCSGIPSALCVNQPREPTCQCPGPQYIPSEEGDRCLPTKIGVKCSIGSSCEKLKGASCYGAPEEAICLCLWTIPNYELTRCLNFEETLKKL